MTSFVITFCGQRCRRHVVGQRAVSDSIGPSVVCSCWSTAFIACDDDGDDDDDDEIVYFTVRWKTSNVVLSTAPKTCSNYVTTTLTDDEVSYFTVRWKTRELVLSTGPKTWDNTDKDSKNRQEALLMQRNRASTSSVEIV